MMQEIELETKVLRIGKQVYLGVRRKDAMNIVPPLQKKQRVKIKLFLDGEKEAVEPKIIAEQNPCASC